MTKSAAVATDNFGAVWADERLKLPEHHTTKIGEFDVEVKEVTTDVPEHDAWTWCVSNECRVDADEDNRLSARGRAVSRDDARELARFATEFLRMSSVEGLRGLLQRVKP